MRDRFFFSLFNKTFLKSNSRKRISLNQRKERFIGLCKTSSALWRKSILIFSRKRRKKCNSFFLGLAPLRKKIRKKLISCFLFMCCFITEVVPMRKTKISTRNSPSFMKIPSCLKKSRATRKIFSFRNLFFRNCSPF